MRVIFGGRVADMTKPNDVVGINGVDEVTDREIARRIKAEAFKHLPGKTGSHSRTRTRSGQTESIGGAGVPGAGGKNGKLSAVKEMSTIEKVRTLSDDDGVDWSGFDLDFEPGATLPPTGGTTGAGGRLTKKRSLPPAAATRELDDQAKTLVVPRVDLVKEKLWDSELDRVAMASKTKTEFQQAFVESTQMMVMEPTPHRRTSLQHTATPPPPMPPPTPTLTPPPPPFSSGGRA